MSAFLEYGCVKCQKQHVSNDPVYAEHALYQSKEGTKTHTHIWDPQMNGEGISIEACESCLTVCRWEKAYQGPFGMKEAEGLVTDLRKVACGDENDIYDARMVERDFDAPDHADNYDVQILTSESV